MSTLRARSGRGFTSAAALLVAAGAAVASAQPPNDLPNPYRTIENHFKLPAGRTWGSTSAVAIDPDGESIWVAERCGANSCAGSDLPAVLKFDAGGNLLKSFGSGMFIFPHGFHIDAGGNIWVTDARGPDGENPDLDGKGHQVVKFSPDGEILLTLGTPGVAGDGSGRLLFTPCDVVTAPNGDIFVSEGHTGHPDAPPETVARIVKFDKDGNFIKSWGRLGSGPGEFMTPHGMGVRFAGAPVRCRPRRQPHPDLRPGTATISMNGRSSAG